MTARDWPTLAGEISGFGSENPGYETSCRRMVLAAADWLERNPRVFLDWRERRPKIAGVPSDQVFIAAAWEDVIRPQNQRTRELLDLMHRACCGDQGDRAGPSYAMMAKALEHARYIKANGWDAYVAMMAARRSAEERSA